MIIPIKLSLKEKAHLKRIEEELTACGCDKSAREFMCQKKIKLSGDELFIIVTLQYFIACRYEDFCFNIETSGLFTDKPKDIFHSDLNLYLPFLQENTF